MKQSKRSRMKTSNGQPVKSGEFRLPGRKALQPSDTLIEVVLIDATEHPIEQPKKAATALQR